MNQEDIIRMAQEAGFIVNWQHADVAEVKAQRYERFAELVAAAEREACAKVCELQEDNGGEWDVQQQCANAIRARGQA